METYSLVRFGEQGADGTLLSKPNANLSDALEWAEHKLAGPYYRAKPETRWVLFDGRLDALAHFNEEGKRTDRTWFK